MIDANLMADFFAAIFFGGYTESIQIERRDGQEGPGSEQVAQNGEYFHNLTGSRCKFAFCRSHRSQMERPRS